PGDLGPSGGRQRLRVDPEALRVVVAQLRDLREGQGKEVGDRMAGDLDADAIDDDRAADPVGSERRHLGGDPAADRVADHADVAQVEFLEQGDVDGGEV